MVKGGEGGMAAAAAAAASASTSALCWSCCHHHLFSVGASLAPPLSPQSLCFSHPLQWQHRGPSKQGNAAALQFKRKPKRQVLRIAVRCKRSWLQSSASSYSFISSSSWADGQGETVTLHHTSDAERTEEVWEEFFLDPSQWWYHGSDKKNPRFPEFQHKSAKKELWIHSSLNPPWVHARLAAMLNTLKQEHSVPEISDRVSRIEQLWLEFFSDPSQWWDNRVAKTSSKYPDFKHKTTEEGLWIEGRSNPPWVKKVMVTMPLDEQQVGFFFRSRVPETYNNLRKLDKLCQEGRLKEALQVVETMVHQNIQVPISTLACLLKLSSRKKSLVEGKLLHALIVQIGLDTNTFLGNHLIEMYSKCDSLPDAHRVFNAMPVHTVFSWTAIISANAEHGEDEEAIRLFQQMQQIGIAADKVVYVVVLKACARVGNVEQGMQIHYCIIKEGFNSNVILCSALIDMYQKCGCIADACRVFNNMHERDGVSWNAMLTGFAEHGLENKALALYERMKKENVKLNSTTFIILLKAFTGIAALQDGKQLHTDIIKSGFESNLMVANSLIEMYAKCGCIAEAREVFLNMKTRNVVSFTSLIAGCAQQGLGKEVLLLYEQMKQEGIQPDKVIYLVLLKACAGIEDLEQGKELHSQIMLGGFESDDTVSGALIEMYIRCGSPEHAFQVFNGMSKRNMICWNLIISGYVQQGQAKEALLQYEEMKLEGVQANNTTFALLLNACASIGALEEGKQLHSEITEIDLDSDMIVGSALVDMYAKCGCVEIAVKVFNKIQERDVVLWNAMIAGLAHQGLAEKALAVFNQMQREGMKPNKSTYIGVLSACSRSGLIDEGFRLFSSMSKDHGITPTLDHYSCIVDLLCRAGRLCDAEDLISQMPIQPNAVIWLTLLGAARSHGDVEVGRHAFDHLVKLEPENPTAYVLLSNIYAAAGHDDEVVKIRREMKEAGAKEPFCM